MKFIPPAVSRWYRYDWQYAVDVSRIRVLPTASLIIALMPMALSFKSVLDLFGGTIPLSLWLLWPASITFVSAWTLVFAVCPKFVREYRDFGEFKKRQHSHRWIVWEFYNNLESLAGWKTIVRESFLKGIARESEEITDQDAREALAKFPQQTEDDSVQVFPPINVKRDIYLPIYCDGKKWVLFLQEDDPKIEQKEKELFWILYSQAAKERPIWRTIFWVLVIISSLLVASNVFKNIVLAVRQLLLG
ncbi:MAG: hypothetical protein ACK4UN_00325 [Limisphaerales bacterium]